MLKKIKQFITAHPVLTGCITPHGPVLLFAMGLMLAESLVLLLNPWLAGQFINALTGATVFSGFSYQQVLLCWFAVLLIQAILAFTSRYMVSMTGEKLLAMMRTRLFDHIQSLPLSYFHNRKRGEVLSLMTNDVYYLGDFLTGPVLGLLPQLITFLGALVFIYIIYPPFAFILGVSFPLFFLVIKIIGRKIRPITRAMIDEYSNTLAVNEENLQLLPVIKSFTREAFESRRYQELNNRLLSLTGRYLRIQTLLSPLTYFLAATAILVLLWISSDRLINNEMSIAGLVSLILYSMLLIRPVSSIADIYGQLQRTLGAAERLINIFNIEPEPMVKNALELSGVKGKIDFQDVSFNYPEREPLLNGLSLVIEAGETIAIIGKNGAGKSTLAYLLERHADPQQGCILVDGIDIKTVSLTSLRQQVGVVHQNVLLLNDTVRENILFGQPHVDRSLLDKVMFASGVAAFMNVLPEGPDTLIGDQGIKLSGGQKQRIALARALLKNPPILILDEATAMLDTESEELMVDECFQTLKKKTVIIITHRPATLALADRVVEIKNGKIYESVHLVRSEML